VGRLIEPPAIVLSDIQKNSPQLLTFDDLVVALDKEPESTTLAYRLGIWFLREKKFEEAKQVLRALLKVENCFEVLDKYATCLYNLGQWDESIHIAGQALMLNEGTRSQRFDLFRFMGNSFLQLRIFEAAEEAYEKAFLAQPGSDILQVNFGTLWIQRNDWNRATECFRYALFLNEKNDKAWVGLALCHQIRGDFELARANLDRALDEAPLNETALSLLIEWARERSEFLRAKNRFFDFTDQGGFSLAVSKSFIRRAIEFGEPEIADWEEFHLQVRGDHV
jgi:tetratricopeptide (TPR) repeat protein